MIKVLLLQLFFVSLTFASKLSRFNFRKDLEKLKVCLESGEDYSQVLNSFNSDSRQLFSEPLSPSQEAIREYINIKEEMICLLFNSPSTDHKLAEINTLNSVLAEELPRYESLFSRETLHIILSFLLRASTNSNIDITRSIASKMTDKLSPL